jgi:hydroxyethylthiazole kinase-like uncharacterized protein yjeF
MRPVLTSEEMRDVDARAALEVPTSVLVERAGTAAAVAALGLLGGAYGRRVIVVAGKGHNGDDGRVLARILQRRGASVSVVDAGSRTELPLVDLVVDAAYGTAFHGTYTAPRVEVATPVLAIDIPSGVIADTGAACEGAVRADLTVTFGALKPGLLLGEGRVCSGRVELAPIGLRVDEARAYLVGDEDCSWLAPRRLDGHKWDAAVFVLAGSPGMAGAAALAARGALRAGSGMVRLGSPGLAPGTVPVSEAVAIPLPAEGFAHGVLEQVGRCKALVAGPGLGTSEAVRSGLLRLLAEADLPVVLDADGLNVLGGLDELALLLRRRFAPVVLTPHDGEFARLLGRSPGQDRLGAARELARRSGAHVLLKGSTTVVAEPSGKVLLAAAGSPRLATAGTGDVLSGMIGAFLARGMPAARAAGLAAHVHGRAAQHGLVEGLVSGDLPELVAAFLSRHAGSGQKAQRPLGGGS